VDNDKQVASRGYLVRFAYVSIAAALLTIGLKSWAYLLTGSVGLLSDAIESTVNLAAAVIALLALRAAAKPADSVHHYGRGKAEYLSAAVEGFLIFGAAAAILVTAIPRLFNPEDLERLGLGLVITLLATAINGVVGTVLLRAGRRHRSATLQADGHHLLTDVWTSAGVVVGVALVLVTGWVILDPLIAIAVAINIMVVGVGLIRGSVRSLLDVSLDPAEHERIVTVLREHANDGVTFHALQTREAGQARYMTVHMLVPGDWTVAASHDRVEDLEAALHVVVTDLEIMVHIEPLEDPRAYGDYQGGIDLPHS
jgi:cation diffusion facilitator family transporter